MATTMSPTAITFNDGSTQATAGGTSVNAITVGLASGTYTKPATVKSIKVTVVGGGGPGGTMFASPGYRNSGGGGGGAAIRYYPATSIPGPQPYTVGGAGGTSSFGVAPITVVSATAGGTGTQNSSTTNYFAAAAGGVGSNGNINFVGQPSDLGGGSNTAGGSSLMGFGGNAYNSINNIAFPGVGFGGGGSGVITPVSLVMLSSGTGSSGVVIIEEFY